MRPELPLRRNRDECDAKALAQRLALHITTPLIKILTRHIVPASDLAHAGPINADLAQYSQLLFARPATPALNADSWSGSDGRPL